MLCLSCTTNPANHLKPRLVAAGLLLEQVRLGDVSPGRSSEALQGLQRHGNTNKETTVAIIIVMRIIDLKRIKALVITKRNNNSTYETSFSSTTSKTETKTKTN